MRLPDIQAGSTMGTGPRRDAVLEEHLDDLAHREGGDQQRGDAGAAHGAEGDALHGDGGQHGDDDAECDGRDDRNGGEQGEPDRVARDGHHLAMGEVDEPHDGEHDGEPKRQQRIDAAEADGVDALLEEDFHVAHAAR